MVSIEQLVPQDHILRKIDAAIDFDFIYDLVEERYCPDNGRPSIDPVVLIKIAVIQYMFGIKSMRQTIKEIEVNIAYRWFLGLDFYDKVPHFSTFGKNYKRRFEVYKGEELIVYDVIGGTVPSVWEYVQRSKTRRRGYMSSKYIASVGPASVETTDTIN